MKMVRLEDDVHKDLTNLGAKNESYSKIIRRLIDAYKVKKWLRKIFINVTVAEHNS